MEKKILVLVLASLAALFLSFFFPMSNSARPAMTWNATLLGEPSAVIEGLQSLKLVLEIATLGTTLVLGIYGIVILAKRQRKRRPPFYTYFDKSSRVQA